MTDLEDQRPTGRYLRADDIFVGVRSLLISLSKDLKNKTVTRRRAAELIDLMVEGLYGGLDNIVNAEEATPGPERGETTKGKDGPS